MVAAASIGPFLTLAATNSIGANHPGSPGQSRIWRLCPVSRPEIAIYLKWPRFSRLLLLRAGIIQSKESKIRKLWLESLNHEQNSALLLSVYHKHCFAVLWVGLSIINNYTEHAQQQLLTINLRECHYKMAPRFFCPGNFSLEVGTYNYIYAIAKPHSI